jgi:hypothetical protein
MRKMNALIVCFLILFSGAVITVDSVHNHTVHQFVESISFAQDISISFEEGHCVIDMEGCTHQIQETGAPQIPIYVRTFSFPRSTRIMEVSLDYKVIHTTMLSNKLLPCKGTQDFIHSYKDSLSLNCFKDSTVYEHDALFPGKWYDHSIRCGLNEQGIPTTFVTVSCYPVQYNPVKDMLCYLQEAEISIVSDMNLHKGSTHHDVDMVIIAPSEFSNNLTALINHKNDHGIKTLLKTTEDIYLEYSGLDKPEKIKYFIKDALEQWGIKYVLLVGGLKSYWYADDKDDGNQGSLGWHVPVRYMNIQHSDETSCISDLYYADIYRYNQDLGTWEFEDWNSYEDDVLAYWPRFGSDRDDIDLAPDVYVGRLACRNNDEVETIVQKIITYESTGPDEKPWLKKMIGIGGKTFEYHEGKPDGEWACDVAIEYMEDMVDEVVRVYATNNETGGPRPIPRDIVQELSKGAGFVIFQGHGNPMSWNTIWADGDYYDHDWAGGVSVYNYPRLSNAEKLPIVVVGGCHNGLYNVSILQILLNRRLNNDNYWCWYPTPVCFSWGLCMLPRGGAIAATGCTGYGFDRNSPIDFSGGLDVYLFYQIGKNMSTTLGQAHSGAIQKYMNENSITQDHAFCISVFQLFGDPSLKIGGYE